MIDYLADDEKLKSFFSNRPNLNGIGNSIKTRLNYKTDRLALVECLNNQYQSVKTSEKVLNNIESLKKQNVFTVCTAHQPNIFTGHLYFIYKIIHAIKLAEELNQSFADYSFVPVYYMGSEDADLNELAEVFINGKDYKWKTQQSGAVGRMNVDEELISIINDVEAHLSNEPYGPDILTKIKSAYSKGKTIQQATFEFVNELFQNYGLIVLMPDSKELKRLFNEVVEKELTTQFSKKEIGRAHV